MGAPGAKRRLAKESLWISEHAVLRFIERLAPTFSFRAARGRLVQMAHARAFRPTDQRLPDGSSVYVSDDEPNAKFIVKDDANGLREVVTVLRADQSDESLPEVDGVDPEEMRIAMATWGRRGRR